MAFVLLVLAYLATHLYGLLELPVFADEAIYIRWAQLIIDEPARYFFFSMNDGKTPLFFWLLTPFQFMFDDQLFAARIVSVLTGLMQMVVIMRITGLLTKNKKTQYVAGLLVMILPFWFFHHRMALTDGLLTVMISVSIFFLIREITQQSSIKKLSITSLFGLLKKKQTFFNVFMAGIFFGLALYAKIPAILFVPSLFLLIFLVRQKSTNALLLAASKVFVSFSIGMGMFLALSFVPSFSQLFGRGSDFLFPLSEVLAGKWKETIVGLPVYAGYFFSYMTPTVILFMVLGLFGKKNKTIVHIFFWSGLLYVLPVGIMGRMVYARYLFPAVLLFTLASVFAIEDLFVWSKQFSKKIVLYIVFSSFLVLLLANTIATSAVFIVAAVTNHRQIPFVSSDAVQYLTEWSSGHGLYETSQLLKAESRNKTIAVATEGYFGSLPDGLNLYFHRRDVSNISIDGVGYPVGGIPEKFAQNARKFERKWLVVNSHRNNLNLDEKYLLREYCRPFKAPCLQVWDITDVFEDLVVR
ncbi:MAG: hypothetical protein BroJett025_05600 [Patescibacteria group bacterium]|nr:MAG: hypothetical protein BroJett025_05600 [Patescibacteria group bacterium]